MAMGYALQQLPERFKLQPRTAAFTAYIERKYSKHGWAKDKSIAYNPAWQPEDSRDFYRWVEHPTDGLRKVDDAHKIVRSDTTGYYIDNFQNETVHGEVYQLPARKGKSLYVPAVSDPYNDGACLDFSSITDEKEQAAYWAEQMAERWAEREREYQAKEDAKNRLEEIADEIQTTYKDFRRIARELRANCAKVEGVTVVRELVSKEWKRTKAAIHGLRTEREKIEREGISYY